MALIDNINAYWKLDESSGNAADATGNGNTLVATAIQGYVAGIINNGVDLEVGSSDYMTAADSVSLSITGDMSISIWFKLESGVPSNDQYHLFSKGSGGNNSYRFRIEDEVGQESFRFNYLGSGTETLSRANATISTGTWHHVVVTVDVSASAAGMLYYFDGSVLTTSDTDGTSTDINDTNSNGQLGTYWGAAFGFFDGVLDECGIWSRILTSGEVTELYNAGAGLQYPFSGGGGAANHWLLMGA